MFFTLLVFLVHSPTQESIDFRRSHVLGMPLVVKEDVTFDPVNVGFFGTRTVMANPAHFAHLVQ